jgi:DNA helicase-2/ATP-dependent DNA helicase PcrA
MVLRSEGPVVVVEAPAGCGKTYEAVSCALDLASTLDEGQEVLLLAHTNAAVGEFRRRSRAAGARIRAATLDAFAVELIGPYATELGLRAPLVCGNGPGETPFRQLAGKALELLSRAPSIAAAQGRHYPVMLLDEHQDTRTDQHALALALANPASGRIRIFGDPMQAIYGFAGEDLLDWAKLAANADRAVALEQPQRWRETPELGEWIMAARAALQAGERLPMADRPACVRLERLADLDDVHPNSARPASALARLLRRELPRLRGTVAVLSRNKAHLRGLLSVARDHLVAQEGADVELAYQILAHAEAAVGDPQTLANSVIELLGATSTGLTGQLKAQLAGSLLPDRLDRGRRARIASLLECLESLYATPDLATWCGTIRRVLAEPPPWLRIDLPASLQLLGRLQPHHDEPARVALDVVARRRRDSAAVPARCASTIHRAKGAEFDHVILAHCSASPFPDTEDARRLLYVALSRARRSVLIVASGRAPSTLLPPCR